MAIELRREDLNSIEEHGREEYPNECCGVLLGKDQGDRKIITGILPLKNARAANENGPGEQSQTVELLKQAYQLFLRIHPKDDLIRDWLQRTDAVLNSARTRFTILPEDLLASDTEARQRGVDILGFYHSHPDHPARPSEYDRQHLLCPWYTTYLILSVEKRVPRELTGWSPSEDVENFVPNEIKVIDGTGTEASIASGAPNKQGVE